MVMSADTMRVFNVPTDNISGAVLSKYELRLTQCLESFQTITNL